MPNFDKLHEHVKNLDSLLKQKEMGVGSWCIMVGEQWKAIADMYYGNIKDKQ